MTTPIPPARRIAHLVELEGSRIILRKNADDAVSRLRGRFKLPAGVTTDDVMRELRGRGPGDPVEP